MEWQIQTLNFFIKKYLAVIFTNQGMKICLIGIASDIHLHLRCKWTTDMFLLNNENHLIKVQMVINNWSLNLYYERVNGNNHLSLKKVKLLFLAQSWK